jgi:hypothetical protein
LIISRSILLRKENVSDKFVEEIKTHLRSITFFENCTVYEVMWKNAERGRPYVTTWRMLIACWIPKAKNANIWVV